MSSMKTQRGAANVCAFSTHVRRAVASSIIHLGLREIYEHVGNTKRGRRHALCETVIRYSSSDEAEITEQPAPYRVSG